MPEEQRRPDINGSVDVLLLGTQEMPLVATNPCGVIRPKQRPEILTECFFFGS